MSGCLLRGLEFTLVLEQRRHIFHGCGWFGIILTLVNSHILFRYNKEAFRQLSISFFIVTRVLLTKVEVGI
jgi:hypothetical protein